MTNFIYNMQDELFHLNMILPVGEFSPIKKLVDHIEAQGKQLRELNAAITKRNATIEKYEREKKELQNRNNYLGKKVNELNQGIRNSEDLTWKQKYDALLQSSEQAIGALQKKCQEYKNSESDATANNIVALIGENQKLFHENNELKEKNEELKKHVNSMYGVASKSRTRDSYISEPEAKVKDLEAANEKLLAQDRVRNSVISLSSELNTKIDNQSKEITRLLKNQEMLKEDLEKEKQVSKDLNVIINSKNKLLDEYMTKCNNLEHNYKEEVRMKEQFKTICFRHERTIKKLKRDNDILQGKINEISDLAESIVMLYKDEE